jgi:hypothetical protein
MPKVKWGGDIDADAIEQAENNQGYNGPLPPSGVYRFSIKFMQRTMSSNNNPMVKILLLLDGKTDPLKPEHERYHGCPVWEQIPVMKSTAFRIRELCDALNISAVDFMNKTIVDEDGNIQKIGSLKIADQDLLVTYKARQENDPEYGERLARPKKGPGFLPFREDDEDDDKEDDGDADDGDSEGDPF